MGQGRRVGVRELRQNLSVYLRQVRDGASLEVTEHGRAVAALVPLDDSASPSQRLVAVGRATEAKGDLLELGPPRGRVSDRVGRALAEARAERP